MSMTEPQASVAVVNIERDIRIAIWNTCCWQGKPQAVAQSFIQHAMDEPCMKNALTAIAAVEATLRPVEAEERWQPIETAPFGATDVLLVFPNGRIAVGWRHSADYFLDSRAELFGQEPIHWQPLPEPPAAIRDHRTKGRGDAARTLAPQPPEEV